MMRERLLQKIMGWFNETEAGGETGVRPRTLTRGPLTPVLDPHDRRHADLLVSERGRRPATERVAVQVRLAADGPERLRPFAERRDSIPLARDYEYIVAPLMCSHDAAVQAARRQGQKRGRAMRCVVDLELRGALMVDCTDVRHLDERALHDNEPRAMALLRALRDVGVDLIWLRAGAGHVAVIFTQSVGWTIRVLGETIYEVHADGPPSAVAASKFATSATPASPSSEPQRRSPRRLRTIPRRWSWGRLLVLFGGQLLVAIFCAIIAPAAVGLLGIEISLPLWVVLVASVLLGSILAQMACKTLKPHLQRLLAFFNAVGRLPDALRELREDRDYLRKGMTEMLEEAREDEEDGTEGDDEDEDDEEDGTGEDEDDRDDDEDKGSLFQPTR
jgi:uncharacterized integral membrane protein